MYWGNINLSLRWGPVILLHIFSVISSLFAAYLNEIDTDRVYIFIYINWRIAELFNTKSTLSVVTFLCPSVSSNPYSGCYLFGVNSVLPGQKYSINLTCGTVAWHKHKVFTSMQCSYVSGWFWLILISQKYEQLNSNQSEWTLLTRLYVYISYKIVKRGKPNVIHSS